MIFSKDELLMGINIGEEIAKATGKILDYDQGKNIVEYLKKTYELEDWSKYLKNINSNYFQEKVEGALGCQLIERTLDIGKEEYDDQILINNKAKVKINEQEQIIIVQLSEENDYLQIIDNTTQEVIYQWD